MFRNLAFPSRLIFLFLLLTGSAHATDYVQDVEILHLLNRISFGPTPGDVEAVRRIGVNPYIEQQLNPNTLPMSLVLQSRLEQLTTTSSSLEKLAQDFQPFVDEGKLSAEQRQELNKRLNKVAFELSEAKILRATLSPAQLQEIMTDFWFNHFNVFYGKGLDRLLISTYERDAIRPHALGKFRDLLEATARHPAMLYYLDNWQNTDPNSRLARKMALRQNKELGINENYAREIMELHTLGVKGGYTQQDVTTLAHILTGWGISRGPLWSNKTTFTFDPERHDYSNQIFLGHAISGQGADEIEKTLDILAKHPSTAHHIAYQLAEYFVTDTPPEALVIKLTETFKSTNGDIAAVLRDLFHSPEFWEPKYRNIKFKPPLRYVISTLRAGSLAPEGDTRALQGAIANMGEPLYRCQTPNGYSNTNDQWLNSDAILKRITFAKSVSRLPNESLLGSIYKSLGDNWSTNTINSAETTAPHLRPVLLLSSPEFLYY